MLAALALWPAGGEPPPTLPAPPLDSKRPTAAAASKLQQGLAAQPPTHLRRRTLQARGRRLGERLVMGRWHRASSIRRPPASAHAPQLLGHPLAQPSRSKPPARLNSSAGWNVLIESLASRWRRDHFLGGSKPCRCEGRLGRRLCASRTGRRLENKAGRRRSSPRTSTESRSSRRGF